MINSIIMITNVRIKYDLPLKKESSDILNYCCYFYELGSFLPM